MRVFVVLVILVLSSAIFSQSGRRAPDIKVPVPPPAEVSQPSPTPANEDPPPVTAEKNEEYHCSDDGSLARILDKEDTGEHVLSAKEVDTRAVITSKPKPSYTKEARRNGIQGFVTLRVLLSARAQD